MDVTKLENIYDTSARKVHQNWPPFLIYLSKLICCIHYLLTTICVTMTQRTPGMSDCCLHIVVMSELLSLFRESEL